MMYNKKGIGAEIDWILGVGLFILSISFIFVFFKPGITPVYDSQTLLDILQTGFEENTNWNITQVPIFVTPVFTDYYGDTGTASLSDDGFNALGRTDYTGPTTGGDYFDQLSDFIEDKTEQNMKLFYVVRIIPERPGIPREEDNPPDDTVDEASGNEEIEDYCGSDDRRRDLSDEEEERRSNFCDPVEDNNPRRTIFERSRTDLDNYAERASGGPHNSVERDAQLELTRTEESLIIPVRLDEAGGKTKYLLTVSDKPINFLISESVTEDYKGCFAVGDPFDSFSGFTLPTGTEPRETECDVLYELGASEKLSGIHYPSILNLKNIHRDNCESYDCVKEDWKFPTSKEFSIEVESIPESGVGGNVCNSGEQLCFKFPANAPDAPPNVNVFVRQFNSFILSDDGVKLPVIVRIKLW